MANSRRSGFGAFLGGALALLILLVLIAAIVAFGGLYPVGASSPHSTPIRWLLTESREHSVKRAASGLTPPQFSAADIRAGAGHFKGMCQECHGGPGAEPEEFAAGMNPPPARSFEGCRRPQRLGSVLDREERHQDDRHAIICKDRSGRGFVEGGGIREGDVEVHRFAICVDPERPRRRARAPSRDDRRQSAR